MDREIYKRVQDGDTYTIEFSEDAHSKKSKFPWLFSVFVKFDNFDETKDGYEEFLETKESLIIAIEYENNARYVGTRVVDGWSELYFYTANSKGFNTTVADILNPSRYIFESNIVKDAKWNFYEVQLLPTEMESHQIVSNQIIFLLEEEGDTLEVPREVEHYAVFDTATQKERFRELAKADGFEYKDDLSTDEYEHGVAMIKTHSVTRDEVAKIVESICKLLKKEHGFYEGWSTTLVTKS
ncbi:MAG: DUF695 domain-containing protein [Campylobacterales bacterium]|nr:DUF695 domain-containing protein [Campylobacterales bacterium]